MPIPAIYMKTLSRLKINGKRLKIYVETGLARGEGVALALKYGFKEVTSLEFYPEYIQLAREKFKENSQSGSINFIQGDSGENLRNCISNYADPFLLFLDAHGHNAGTCPLSKEISEVKGLDKNLLLLIDDVYFIEYAKENPNRAPWANEINGLNKLKNMITDSFQTKPLFIKLIYPFAPAYSEGGKNYILLAINPKIKYTKYILYLLKITSLIFQILNPIMRLAKDTIKKIIS